MIDLESHLLAVKASWVPRIVNDNSNWSELGRYYLAKFGQNYNILRCSFNSESQIPIIKSIPQFYVNVIVAFNMSKSIEYPDTLDHLLSEHLWGNRFLTIHSKPLKTKVTIYYKHWIKDKR